jgi:hypothetical protein
MTLRLLLALLVALVASGTVAHGQTSPPPTQAPLPPNHPPVGGGPGGGRLTVTPPATDAGTGKQGLQWTAPPGWTKETPSSAMRRAQYRISGAAGDAECVVFYFGPGQGGDTKSNIARWTDQFRRAAGKPIGDAARTRTIKVGGVSVAVVEVAGTYVGGMGGTPTSGDRPDYMLLGAIADGPDAKWFFRATGPRATLESQRAAFDTMIRSIKPGS